MKRITVIGSTKYKEEIQKVQHDLVLAGYFVYPIIVFSHADNEDLSVDNMNHLREMKKMQISECDVVYVVQPNDTKLGESTRDEIQMAKEYDKVILINGELLMR